VGVDAVPNGGASSIEVWDDEPACISGPDTGFAMNQRSADMLRWYAYLNNVTDIGEQS
jgi:hypothetical protein